MSMDMGSIMSESDVPNRSPNDIFNELAKIPKPTPITISLQVEVVEEIKELKQRVADLEKYTNELAQYIRVLQDVTVALTMKSNDQAEALHKIIQPKRKKIFIVVWCRHHQEVHHGYGGSRPTV